MVNVTTNYTRSLPAWNYRSQRVTFSADLSHLQRPSHVLPAVVGDTVYIKLANKNDILEYDTNKGNWSVIKNYPISSGGFSIVNININVLTTIGGNGILSSNKLYCYKPTLIEDMGRNIPSNAIQGPYSSSCVHSKPFSGNCYWIRLRGRSNKSSSYEYWHTQLNGLR